MYEVFFKERSVEMKRIIFYLLFMIMGIGLVAAQEKAEIEFDKTTHDFGKVSKENATVSCSFTFTNVGNLPLVIHQATASCGCTVPEYTQEPVLPGETGTIKITFNGSHQYPGHFKKTITLHTNTESGISRLYIEGTLISKENEKDSK